MFKRSMRAMLGVVLVSTGCSATIPQLRARAALDLSCAPEGLLVQPLDGATEIVSGCGKRALYVQLFNNSRYPTWLLNSSIEPAGHSLGTASAR